MATNLKVKALCHWAIQLAGLVFLPTLAQSSPEQVPPLNNPKLRLEVVLNQPQGATRDAYVTITNISGAPLELSQYHLVREGTKEAVNIQCQNIAGEAVALTSDQAICLSELLLDTVVLQGGSKHFTLVAKPSEGASNAELTLSIQDSSKSLACKPVSKKGIVERPWSLEKVITHIALPVVTLVATLVCAWYGWEKYTAQQNLQQGIKDKDEERLFDAGTQLLTAYQKRHRLDLATQSRLAEAMNELGSRFMQKDEHGQALKCFEQALTMREALYEESHPDVAQSLNNVGVAYGALGDDQASPYLIEALAMRETLYEEDHPDIAESLNNLGAACQALGDDDEALLYLMKALTMRQALYKDEDHPEVAKSLNNVGEVYYRLGTYEEALLHLKEALVMRQALYEENHPEVAQSLNNVGVAYQALGNDHEALLYLIEALIMRKALYRDEDHPEVAESLNNVGVACQALEDDDELLMYLMETLTMRKVLYKDEDHPEVAEPLNNAGGAYQALEDYNEFFESQEQSLTMAHCEEQCPSVADFLNNAGTAYYDLGKSPQHLQCPEQVPAVPAVPQARKASIGHNLGSKCHVVAREAQQKGEQQRAEAYLAKASSAFEESIKVNNSVKADLWVAYGSFLLATGQPAQAYAYLTAAIASNDSERWLYYDAQDKEIIVPILQEKLAQDKEIMLRGIDYAYYLLIHHYGAFEQTGIHPAESKASYLAAYQQALEQRRGQQGGQRADALAYYLYQALVDAQATA